MPKKNKITSAKELKKHIDELKSANKRIVLCQGHFNVIHPGHLRFIEYAKLQGDSLIVAVHSKNLLEDKVKDIFFNEEDRLKGVAALEEVDKAFILENIYDIIELIKPDVYVRGQEFNKRVESLKEEINLVEKHGGKVVFSSGQVSYTSVEFLEQDLIDINEKNRDLFRSALKKHSITKEKVGEYLENFSKQNILVLGDSIVDQYIACDALGMSSEAPVLTLRELESKQYVGGAAIVAMHVASLGAKCRYISVIGDDEPGRFLSKELKDKNIEAKLFVDNDRQTTFKIRYLAGKQKILRVSRLHDHQINKKIEAQIISHIESIADKLNGIIFSDFSYGFITPTLTDKIKEIAFKHNIKLFGDSQSSSQIGDITKFKEFYLVTPTEREARIAFSDKYSGLEQLGNTIIESLKLKNLVVKLAEEGFVTYKNISKDNQTLAKTQHFPALAINPVDVVGAGDAMLAALSLSLCDGAELVEAGVIAAGIASIEVNKIGNVPVSLKELHKWLKTI